MSKHVGKGTQRAGTTHIARFSSIRRTFPDKASTVARKVRLLGDADGFVSLHRTNTPAVLTGARTSLNLYSIHHCMEAAEQESAARRVDRRRMVTPITEAPLLHADTLRRDVS